MSRPGGEDGRTRVRFPHGMRRDGGIGMKSGSNEDLRYEVDMIFPGYFAEFAGGLLSNGLTTGGLVALLLTALMARRKTRLRGTLDVAELPRITEFVTLRVSATSPSGS